MWDILNLNEKIRKCSVEYLTVFIVLDYRFSSKTQIKCQPICSTYNSNAGTTQILHHNYTVNTRDNRDCFAYGPRIRHRHSKTGYTELENGTSYQRTEKYTGTLCGFSTRKGNEILQYGIISFSIKIIDIVIS